MGILINAMARFARQKAHISPTTTRACDIRLLNPIDAGCSHALRKDAKADGTMSRFAKVTEEMARDMRLTLRQLRVLVALLLHKSSDGDDVWPSRDSLSEITGYSADRISAVTAQLEVLGYITKAGKGGRGLSTTYTIKTLPKTERVTKTGRDKNPTQNGKETLPKMGRPYKATDQEQTISSNYRNARARTTKVCIELNMQTCGWENISDEQMTLWAAAYPAVDLKSEIAAAAAWIIANPKNRKSNYARYLTNWLKRAQDRAPRNGQQKPPAVGVQQRVTDNPNQRGNYETPIGILQEQRIRKAERDTFMDEWAFGDGPDDLPPNVVNLRKEVY